MKVVIADGSVGRRMSTLAIYGDAGQGVVDELHPVADGPPQMSGVARPWEHAAEHAATDRLVIIRDHNDIIGIVHVTAPNPTHNHDMWRCVPRRLLDAGFEFNYPNFDSAIQDLLVNGG